jgi:hypothetical protein
MDTEQVVTSQLRAGDVVLAHGMRIRLGEIKRYAETSTYNGEFFSSRGTVLNMMEVAITGHVPTAWLQDQSWLEGYGWYVSSRSRWTVQGNDLAMWTRVAS